MPIVVNSNASIQQPRSTYHTPTTPKEKPGRLSSGKRINSAADDAGGLAVAYKLDSRINRTNALIQNSQNALSYLQVQDSALSTVGSIVDRMAELRTMAQDITKNTGDIENYTKEFVELQSQLSQIRNEKFNGISLFASTDSTASGSLLKGTGSYINESGTSLSTTTFSRTLTTHTSADSTLGSISINVINFQFMLSIGTLVTSTSTSGVDLGNVDGARLQRAAESEVMGSLTIFLKSASTN